MRDELDPNDARLSAWIHPVDEIEPEEKAENDYREASVIGLTFIFQTIQFLHDAKSPKELLTRLFACSHALNHPSIEGKTMTESAQCLGVTRADLSAHVCNFERQLNLPPALGQKSGESRNSYHKTRKAQLHE